jgi:signal transduction histidine kinase
MRILIAEDDAISRFILATTIEQLGHSCLCAEDGTVAWALFQTVDVDVVISDRMMPGMDGLELCQRIRTLPKGHYTYFIFLTTLTQQADLVAGMNSGADDYLTKPLRPDELRMRLAVAMRITDLHHQLTAQRIELEQARIATARKEEEDRRMRNEAAVRHQINRDLHDGPTQLVAAMAMNIEVIQKLLHTTPEHVEDELKVLAALVQKTYHDLRTLLFELRPLGLETHGLLPTLQEYALKFRDPTGMQLTFTTGTVTGKLEPQAAAGAFMIIQEAVNNARKHARATMVWIDIYEDTQMLTATVRDNGTGFDVSMVRASDVAQRSYGLLNMHERAVLLGGSCDIQSTIGSGTQVIIHLPINTEAPV